MSEDELRDSVIRLAELLGYRVYHVTDVHGKLRSWTSVGFPDLVLCGNGSLLFAELKAHKGAMSNEQKAWSRLLQWAGREVRLWRPADWISGRIERELRDAAER